MLLIGYTGSAFEFQSDRGLKPELSRHAPGATLQHQGTRGLSQASICAGFVLTAALTNPRLSKWHFLSILLATPLLNRLLS